MEDNQGGKYTVQHDNEPTASIIKNYPQRLLLYIVENLAAKEGDISLRSW